MAGIGSTPELVIGIAAGAAASTALEPALEIPKQDAWASAANRILDERLLAELVARGGVDLSTAQYFAKRNGVDTDPFGALIYLSQTVPGFSLALDLWRRGLLGTAADKSGDTLFRHALVHTGLDQRYIDQLMVYKTNELISPQDLAYMVVRGVLPDEGMLPSNLPTQADKLQLPPQINLSPTSEAARSGWDATRLSAMVDRSGLAMAPVMAAQANFRTRAWQALDNLPAGDKLNHLGLVQSMTDNDYLLTIARGDLFPAFADPVLQTARQILTAGEYTEAELRGWITAEQRRAAVSQHGMTPENSDLLFKVMGRPMNARQVFQAQRRGGTYDGPIDQIDAPFLKSLRESNIRPEWYNLEWAYRFTQPSVFVVRQWVRDGHDPTWAHDKLFAIGWQESDIDKFLTAYTPAGAGTAADTHVAKAQTQLWTTTHRAYLNHKISDAAATTALTAAGVTAAAAPQVLALWQEERNLDRKPLSAAQIKKAWGEAVVNQATGAAWTRDEALAALIELGYSPVDANTFLEL